MKTRTIRKHIAQTLTALFLSAGLKMYAGIDDGLVAYYPLNGDTSDQSGNSRHGTPVNSPTYVNGRLGQAIHLQGSGYVGNSGQHILLPFIDFPSMSAFSISMWVNFEGVTHPDGESFFGTSNDGVNCGTGDFSLASQAILSVGGAYVVTALPSSNVWHLYTMTYTNGTLSAFLDGQWVGAYTGPVILSKTNAGLGVHWWNNEVSTRFIGSIDDVRIYNRAISTNEVREIYTLPELNYGLIAYYPLNGNANDYSGYSRHGTPVNSPTYASGRLGQAIHLQGSGYVGNTGQHVLLPFFDFPSMSAFSISMWVNLEGVSHPDGESFFGTSNDGVNCGTGDFDLASQAVFSVGGASVVTALPSSNVWHLYTMTYADGTLSAFLDGQWVGASTGPVSLSKTNAGLGAHWWNAEVSTRFIGSLDEVRVYNRAISTNEVRQIYTQTELSVQVGAMALSWNSVPTATYQLEYRSSLTTNNWTALGAPTNGTGSNIVVLDYILGQPQKFYRLRVNP